MRARTARRKRSNSSRGSFSIASIPSDMIPGTDDLSAKFQRPTQERGLSPGGSCRLVAECPSEQALQIEGASRKPVPGTFVEGHAFGRIMRSKGKQFSKLLLMEGGRCIRSSTADQGESLDRCRMH